MLMRVYVDNSVIGGYFDEEFKESTIKLFGEFEKGFKKAVISDLTLQELEGAPTHVKEFLTTVKTEMILLDNECIELAKLYIKEKAITPKFFNDALHIATATVNRLDVLVSWNFKHIVNLNRIRLYNAVNLKNGYPIIEIRTPIEIIIEK